jgi:hypothetical protein
MWDKISTLDFGIGGGEGMENTQTGKSIPSLNPNMSLDKALSEGNSNVPSATSTTPIKVDITHTFDFNNLPSNMTNEQITTILKDWAKTNITQDEAQNILKVGSGTNYGQTPKTSNVD